MALPGLEVNAHGDAVSTVWACKSGSVNSFIGHPGIRNLRESCIRENRTCSLSGGRWPARKRATSDPTPMNQPTNEGLLSAEIGEGRAQAEENIVQSYMHPTQSGKRMSQGLRGVRQAARFGLPPCILSKSRMR
jgi:hypothetical protein